MEKANLLGAIVAHIIYLSSIFTFISRLIGQVRLGQWFGSFLLLMIFPLVYLLLKAYEFQRPALYFIQVALMITWIIVLFVLDYWLKIEFVMLFFAGTGGMLGVAALAGREWTISAVILFLIMAILAFVQRSLTGI